MLNENNFIPSILLIFKDILIKIYSSVNFLDQYNKNVQI